MQDLTPAVLSWEDVLVQDLTPAVLSGCPVQDLTPAVLSCDPGCPVLGGGLQFKTVSDPSFPAAFLLFAHPTGLLFDYPIWVSNCWLPCLVVQFEKRIRLKNNVYGIRWCLSYLDLIISVRIC